MSETNQHARHRYEQLQPIPQDIPSELVGIVTLYRLHEAMWGTLHEQLGDAFAPHLREAIEAKDPSAFLRVLGWMPHCVNTAYAIDAWEQANPDISLK